MNRLQEIALVILRNFAQKLKVHWATGLTHVGAVWTKFEYRSVAYFDVREHRSAEIRAQSAGMRKPFISREACVDRDDALYIPVAKAA
jgi:hypothetical protein